MVAICYPVPSFSGAVISYSPAPHLWTLHFQYFSDICLLSFKINQTPNGHEDEIIIALDP
jgi:hypothetical protein